MNFPGVFFFAQHKHTKNCSIHYSALCDDTKDSGSDRKWVEDTTMDPYWQQEAVNINRELKLRCFFYNNNNYIIIQYNSRTTQNDNAIAMNKISIGKDRYLKLFKVQLIKEKNKKFYSAFLLCIVCGM